MPTTKKIVRNHKHPNPEQWANFLAICGIDKGIFSEVTKTAKGFRVALECGITVNVTEGKLQGSYLL